VKNLSEYKRVLLKLSGEALQDATDAATGPLSAAILIRVARELADARRQKDFELAIVIGGGNIFRGALGGPALGLERTTGDQMGMLATLINSLALRDALIAAGLSAEVHSAVSVGGVAPQISIPAARSALASGAVVLFACGTGSPFFTTDTAAALRAAEIRADILFKATKVDGVYTADPVRDPGAKRYEQIGYAEVLEKRLAVMDLTAISFCMENRVPICVFSMLEEGALTKAVLGQASGTVVH